MTTDDLEAEDGDTDDEAPAGTRLPQCRHRQCATIYHGARDNQRRYRCFYRRDDAQYCFYKRRRCFVRLHRKGPASKPSEQLVVSYSRTGENPTGPRGYIGWPKYFRSLAEALEDPYGNELWVGSHCHRSHRQRDDLQAPRRFCVATLHRIHPWMVAGITARLVADIAKSIGPAARNALLHMMAGATAPKGTQSALRHEGTLICRANPVDSPAWRFGVVLEHLSPMYEQTTPQSREQVLVSAGHLIRAVRTLFPRYAVRFDLRADEDTLFRANAVRAGLLVRERMKTLYAIRVALPRRPFRDVELAGMPKRWPVDVAGYDVVTIPEENKGWFRDGPDPRRVRKTRAKRSKRSAAEGQGPVQEAV